MDMEIAIEVNPSQLDHQSIAKLFVTSGWGREEEYDGAVQPKFGVEATP